MALFIGNKTTSVALCGGGPAVQVCDQKPPPFANDAAKFAIRAFDTRNINQAKIAYHKIKTLIFKWQIFRDPFTYVALPSRRASSSKCSVRSRPIIFGTCAAIIRQKRPSPHPTSRAVLAPLVRTASNIGRSKTAIRAKSLPVFTDAIHAFAD